MSKIIANQITRWLQRWGKTFHQTDAGTDYDFGYDNCEMIDSCMYDLDLDESDRSLVSDLVDEYIRTH
jgi:hypothetical protein